MACPQIITGDRFLTRVLTHIDCQADLVGSYGYQALAQPGSLASTIMTGILTLFIAFFGIRLLFGPAPGMRDVVHDVLKIGIVLTLAFSWPAFRTVIHDVVVDGPASIAARLVVTDTNPGTGLLADLQAADDAMLELTRQGTGRNAGALIDAQAPGGTFASTALADDSGYAWSRLVWLAGTIGVYGLLRLLAGLLLALAPLAAGLLLFEQTRGLFSGWLRGLVLALIGTVGETLVLAVELSAITPWLTDALRVRQLGYATPAAPTELFAMTLAFAAIQFGMLALLARVAFTRGLASMSITTGQTVAGETLVSAPAFAPPSSRMVSRAERIADSVEIQLIREGHSGQGRGSWRLPAGQSGTSGPDSQGEYNGLSQSAPRLGSSYRRTSARSSRSSNERSVR